MIDVGSEKTRFYIVWDATEGGAVEEFAFEDEAIERARKEAKSRIGNIIVVFEPKEAFQATAKAERIYLGWPKREPAPALIDRPGVMLGTHPTGSDDEGKNRDIPDTTF